MAKQGAEKSILPPDAEAGRKTGQLRQQEPLLEWQPRCWLVLGSGHYLTPPGSSSVIRGELYVELPSLGTVLRDPLWIIPSLSLLPRACFHLASASHFCTHPAGGGWPQGLQLCSPPPPFAHTSSAGPLWDPSLAFSRMGLALCWGYEIMSPPSHERQSLQNQMQFSIWGFAMRNLVSAIASEAYVGHGGSTNSEVSEIRSEKNRWIDSLWPLTPPPEATAQFQVPIRNVGKMKFPCINGIHRWAWWYL